VDGWLQHRDIDPILLCAIVLTRYSTTQGNDFMIVTYKTHVQRSFRERGSICTNLKSTLNFKMHVTKVKKGVRLLAGISHMMSKWMLHYPENCVVHLWFHQANAKVHRSSSQLPLQVYRFVLGAH